MKKYKHLSPEERTCIENLLRNQISVPKIAATFSRSPAIIRNEIKKHF